MEKKTPDPGIEFSDHFLSHNASTEWKRKTSTEWNGWSLIAVFHSVLGFGFHSVLALWLRKWSENSIAGSGVFPSELWIAKDFPAIPFCAGFHHSVLVSRQEAAAEHTGHAQKGDKLWGWNVLSPAKGSGTFREWKQFTPGWTQNLHRSVGVLCWFGKHIFSPKFHSQLANETELRSSGGNIFWFSFASKSQKPAKSWTFKKKSTSRGARTRDHKVKGLALYRLS